MPHMSPMQWTLTLITLWALLSVVSSNLHFHNKPLKMYPHMKMHPCWKWYSSHKQ